METEKTKNNFESAISLASSRMLSAFGAYSMWKWMNQAININNSGGKKEADRNVEIFNTYTMVFGQLIKSTYKSFVADLSIFFDKNYEDTFTIDNLLVLGKDRFSPQDIIELKTKIAEIKKSHGKNISFLNELRNADVAHQEMDSKSRHLEYINIENLFKAAQEILNLISNKYNNSIHWWDHVEKEMGHQMKWLVDNLERGESVRLEEIRKEYGVDN